MRKLIGAVAVAMLATFVGVAQAAPSAGQKLWDEAMAVARTGPVDVPLLDQAVLHLPAGEVFVPQPQADQLLRSFGNPGTNPEIPGIILPRDPHETWMMAVRFNKSGYIKDDEAASWDADAMLRSLKQGTLEQNVAREQAGMLRIEVLGWTQAPAYDATQHRLVWAMTSRAIVTEKQVPPDVNYNTYALGRYGYFSMNMVTRLSELPRLKPVADQQLAALEYDAGKRYVDFDPKTDRVAGYGLVGLVVGAADQRQSAVSQSLAFVRANAALMALALVVLAGVLVVLRRRISKARAPAAAAVAPSFVNTVAESPIGAPRPAVDLDIGDGPPAAA